MAVFQAPIWPQTVFHGLVALAVRAIAAHPFFVSGQTKIDGPTIGGVVGGVDLTIKIPTAMREAAFALFENEYRLPYIDPDHAAYAAAAAENLLPVLLVLGLLTRLSALGLLVMTLIIQFFVYPDAWWSVHSYWSALLLTLIAIGAGLLSLDQILFRRRG